MQLEEILSTYFGYTSFRSPQKEIITSVIAQQDTLVIMPTGGGKSLCYQIPGLYFSGTTLVISPLISLMQDQVHALQKRNIKAVYINSSLTAKELNTIKKNITQYKFIYLAPERLLTKEWLKISQLVKISLIAIDEAHCISEWGHDFRPPYMQIAQYLKTLQVRPPLIALTATATPKTQSEIIQSLTLIKPTIFRGSFRRSNLQLGIKKCPTTFEKNLTVLMLLYKHANQSGIIYTQTRKQSEAVAGLINFYDPRFSCHAYHAGLESSQRKEIQEQFIANKIKLITATNAFGMGVDKANVRFVIHLGPSNSLENYYQEVGRAGRDGLHSACYLLYHSHDITINQQLLTNTLPEHLAVKQDKLQKMLGLLHTKKCLTNVIQQYFEGKSKQKEESCNCSNCKLLSITFTDSQLKIIKKIVEYRNKISKRLHINQNKIMTDQMIAYTGLLQPQTKSDWLKIPGIGQGWVDRWSDAIIPLV
jgi:ATP-dependent DNA helicase RecQ